jgi:HEPN domain-containing protein
MGKAIHQKWLERVKYDIDTADAMYATGRYIYTVFMCQQALEKSFKALIALKGMEILPIHNLRRLAEITDVVDEISPVDFKKIDFLSQYYLAARYKEDIEELSLQITADTANEYLTFSKEKIEWLTRKIKP